MSREVRAQRDHAFDKFKEQWEKHGRSFHQLSDSVKRAVCTLMARSPACWPIAVTQKKIETQITNYRRPAAKR